ncbi:MAG: hypothetical protein ABW072_06795 [Sedimenticola sp.]
MTIRNVKETHSKALRDPEVAAEYLKEALESRDKAVMRIAFCNIADAYDVEIGQSTIGKDEASKTGDCK